MLLSQLISGACRKDARRFCICQGDIMMNYKRLQLFIFIFSMMIILGCSLYLSNIISYADSVNGVTETTENSGDYWKISGTVNNYDTFVSNYSDKSLVSNYITLDSVFHSSDFTNSYWGSVNTRNGGNLLSFLDEGTERRLLANFPNLYIPCVSMLTYSNNYVCLRDLGAAGGTNRRYQLFIMNTDGSATNCCGDGRYYGIWSLDDPAILLSCTFTVGGELNGEDINSIVLNSYFCTSYNFTQGNISTANTEIGIGYKSYYYNNPSYAPTESFRSICASQWACVFFDYDDFGYEHVPQLPPVSTISGGSGGGSTETSLNNLVMSDSDWVFKHSDYYAPYSDTINTGSVYPNGNIYFQFEPNDFQKEHASDFTVSLSFSFDYDVTYSYDASNDTPPFYNTRGLVTLGQKSCKLHFTYNDDGKETIDVPLSTFVSDGNSYHISFEEVMSNMSGSGYELSNVLALSKEVTSLTYNKFNINCTAFLSSSNESSGNYTEWYNPINKKGYTTDKSAETNKNPYVEENQDYNDTSLNVPGTAGTDGDNANNVGGGSTATATTGSITINNTNNNSATSGSLFDDGIISTLLKLLSNNVVSSSETVSELADVDGFSSVAQSSFSYIPTSIWSLLLVMFTASLGILIIGFIIRIVVNIFF